MSDLNRTLRDRDPRYGNFFVQAHISQSLKAEMANAVNWGEMQDYQREALELIAIKISRILNGDPRYKDSWHDIAGYARLVEEQLEESEKIESVSQQPMGGTLAPPGTGFAGVESRPQYGVGTRHIPDNAI